MVYAKEIKDGEIVGLYTYGFEPHFDENSGMVLITEEEYTSLRDSLSSPEADSDRISDSEALAIITGEVTENDEE